MVCRNDRWVRGTLDAVGEDFDVDVAFAGAVELGEENALPAAKSELAVFDEHNLRGANEHRLHVRVGISFSVAIRRSGRHEAVEGAFRVGGDIGIGVFVDQDSGGGVRDVQVACAALMPSAVTTRCTSCVTSTISVRRVLRTRIDCILASRGISGNGNDVMLAGLLGTGELLEFTQAAAPESQQERKEREIT